ncbi:MAG: stage IV sporulation protein A [Clostridia bacterium]|jgi:stage IV sporulation protein A|nr:stage IV sporulation protein A [Clostridia bacterium]
MENFSVYENIATRTGGDIYIGVVGPVRTGKSTFIKKFMQELVLPQVEGGKKQRYSDELPQSAAGKTVMTTEPKFVPEEAAEIRVKEAVARVRLIDCVGFPVAGAAGFEEEGEPRLVKTPWNDSPVTFELAATEGTQRVIRDHSTIGILMTTDGSVTGISRQAYEEAEERAYSELKEIGKPFVILLNCAEPKNAESLRAQLEEKYRAPVLAVNAEQITAEGIHSVLERILYEFPVVSIDVDLPDWMRVLDADSPFINEVLGGIRALAPDIRKMSDCALLDTLFSDSDCLLPPASVEMDASTGRVKCRVNAKEGAFYQILGEQCGEEIKDDFALMNYIVGLSNAKKVYERVGQAFADAQEFGYGIVPPEESEMSLSEPKVVKKSGRVGVNFHADAPSYHIIRVDVSGEVRPALGNAEQSAQFVKQISTDMETEPERAWNTNMFGRTLKEMLGEELFVKNRSMGEGVRRKMRKTVTRIVNEGKGGVICILL